MLAVLRQRNFALLWLGGMISFVGDNALFVALPFYVYELTHSALATGMMFVAQTLPSVLFGSVAGVYVDRWDRKRTMVIADLSKAFLLLFLLTMRSTEWMWLVYVVAFLQSTISQFFGPAENSLLPRLVGQDRLVAANSLNAMNNNIGMLLGPSIGGVLMGSLGLTSVVLFGSASRLIAGVMISFISCPTVESAGEGSVADHDVVAKAPAKVWTTLWRDWLEGLKQVKENHLVTAVFVTVAMVMLGEGIFSVLLIPFVSGMLQGDALELGWLLTVRGLGGLIGGLIIGWVGGILKPKHLFPFCLLVLGGFALAMFNLHLFPLAVVILFLWGIPAMGAQVSVQTLLQSNVPDRFQGRVFGALGTIASLLALCGQGLASILADHVGVVPMLNVDAALYLLAGVTVWSMLNLYLRTSNAVAREEGSLN